MPEPTFTPFNETAAGDASSGADVPEFFDITAAATGQAAAEQAGGGRNMPERLPSDGFVTGDPEDAIRRAAATAVCDAAAYLQKSQKVGEAALALALARLEEGRDAAGAREFAAAGQEAVGAAVENLAKVSEAAEALLSGLARGTGEPSFMDVVSDAELDIQADR
ncbi:hypothetical protein [Breoghania sp. JC706]|uniref:hypothetical protein n=1 Tax=Breoghania sp. JC706 TaxID=3117732 RepID=UPI0030093560